MAPTLNKLKKMLSLEQSHGYRDRAVIGGLKRFVAHWQEEALAAANEDRTKRQIRIVSELLRGYEHKDLESRESTVREVMRQVQSIEELEQRGSEKPSSAPSQAETAPSDRRSQGKPEPEALPQQRPAPPSPEEAQERVERATQTQRRPPETNLDLSTPVDALRGISDTYRRRLGRLGVRTVEDLLYLFPRRHDDFSALKTVNQLEYGEEVTIVGTVWEASNRRTRSGQTITTVTFSDATGTIQATWFNQPYLTRQLRRGRKIVLSGQVEKYLGRLTFQAPEWEPLDQKLLHTARLVPVYPLTKGIGARWMRRLMHRIVENWVGAVEEYLPEHIRERESLLSIKEALTQIHFPDDGDTLEEARRRLSFDEFLLIQLGVLRQRRMWQQETAHALEIDHDVLKLTIDSLPFQLTSAQDRVLNEILHDVTHERPMSRLLQGDVGSGKTVVAVTAMLMAVANEAQAALMAPTEILAEQHYRSVTNFLESLTAEVGSSETAADSPRPAADFPRPKVRLLTGSLTRSEKDAVYEEMAAGEADIVIGTHALIQEGVEFDELAFVVIDEQHRFGVSQRSALRQKGYAPHVLVMSATPIPRTLALTVYGDLDISVIDEMPPGRQMIRTRKVPPRERERAYQFVRSQIEKGRQAFVICPLVEASDKIEAKAATEEYERLQKEVFPDLELGLMHGRLKNDEKETVMAQFRAGDLDTLVSTSVVEVGIDVPNATVMVVEGADRFGLAQLHQFRGRVGRGEHRSYCLLLAQSPSANAQARLDILENTQDGFRLAEEDLKLRGPGEFFGTRQSGLPDLRAAKLSDVDILETARAEALEIFRRDADLSAPEHALLRAHVDAFWQGEGDLS
ncbi:MAG: ATP-dependent DNA helicase RecG [Anaerolineales bacterium]|nr:ATP-dependent DNA helicase RecG [Anaerolineales bacterium]